MNSKVDWIEKQLIKISSLIDNRIKLEAIDTDKARPKLERRINQLAQKNHFTFNKLSIKNQNIWINSKK